MNFTANSRRAAVLSLFSFLVVSTPGCIATDPNFNSSELSPTESAPTEEIAEGADITPPTEAVASAGALANAEPALVTTRGLIDQADEGLGIEVGEGPGVNRITIQTNSENPTYQVERLVDPPRVVVDLPSERARVNKNIPVSDLEYVSGVRIGTHPDKSRVVLDLTNDAGLLHSAVTEGNKILITLRGNIPAENSNSVALNGDTEGSEFPIGDSGTTARLPDSESAPLDDGGLVRVADHSAATGQQVELTRVSLEKSGTAGNAVVIDITGNPDYSLEKTAPSEYVVTVKNSTLSPEVEAAGLLASPGGSGIRSVRSIADGKNTQVRIFAQPDTYLTARVSGNQLLVEETTDIAQVAEDIRAQLHPEGTADAAKSGKEEAPVKKAEEPAAKPAADTVAANKEKKDETAKITVSNEAAGSSLSEGDIGALLDDSSRYTGRLISLDLQDTDIDNALRIIAEVSNLNIVASDDVTGKVTLRLIDVPWDQALDVILKTNGLDKVLEGNVMRIAPVEKLRQEREALKDAQDAERELQPLSVKYLRVSYAKASELKTLVETVLSERGTVAYDERSNQLIVKDIPNGLKNVVELVNKIDLRTPQVLLETQIVEASRNLTRRLGSELGFQFIQSPATGNGTGLNFPAAIAVGGSAVPGQGITGSSFPVPSGETGGSGITMLFDSADGTKSLELRLSQLEQEGRVRIISRPAVATTNNKAAEIKSVEKVRVKLPNGGLSVATGSGATASGSGNTATETIEAGIILTVTPQASPDYFVLLDIKAKSSSFSARESGDGIPNEIERSASSTVLVSSGQTFALGGIYKITDRDSVSGVPFFKDIPVLGHFFRRADVDNADEELLFFITPRIVEGSFDDASAKVTS